MELAAVGVFC